MANPANKQTLATMRKLEKRAQQKLKRLQDKGVRTGSISPLKQVDTSNKGKVKAYIRDLERFNSRKTQYVAGRDGTPLPAAEVRHYRQLEKQWNKAHRKFWKKYADQPFYTPEGASDVSLGELSSYVHVKGLPYGDINYERKFNVENIRGLKDLRRRINIMKTETSPEYEQKRLQNLQVNMQDFARVMNDQRLIDMIEGMTDDQLLELWNNSDFVEIFYHAYPGKNGNTVSQAMDYESDVQHMLQLVEGVKERKPGTRPQPTPQQPTTPKTSVSKLIQKSNKRRFRR